MDSPIAQVGITPCKNYNSVCPAIKKTFELHTNIRFSGKKVRIIKEHKAVNFLKTDRILLKPNLLMAPKSEAEPVTTDPEVILAVAEILISAGMAVDVGDSPGFGTAGKILDILGISSKLENLGARIVEFTDPLNKRAINVTDKKISEYDKIINLPKLKVHGQLLFTGAVKNLFGLVIGKRKALLHLIHGDKDNSFADMLLAHYNAIKPAMTIVDAIDAMDKMGPRKGVRKNIGLLYSGIDCVAIDRIINESLGVPFKKNRLLVSAQNNGIGNWDITKIKIRGMKEIPKFELQFPPQLPIRFSPSRIVKSVIKNFFIKLNACLNFVLGFYVIYKHVSFNIFT